MIIFGDNKVIRIFQHFCLAPEYGLGVSRTFSSSLEPFMYFVLLVDRKVGSLRLRFDFGQYFDLDDHYLVFQ